MISAALSSGIMNEGVDVYDVGLTSTPALAYLTMREGYSLGIMITASHNSPEYNGIKIISSRGLKLSETEEKELSEIFDNIDSMKPIDHIGRLTIVTSLMEEYVSYLRSKGLDSHLKICFDCSNGALANIVHRVYDGYDNITCINTSTTGLDINVGCGATCLDSLREYMATHRDCDMGVAFDGDGDRIMIVLNDGKILDGDDLVYTFATLSDNCSAVVGTIMSNFGLEKALNRKKINLLRTNVGDKYVLKKMLDNSLDIGGEQAGHIILRANHMIGDGLAVAIELIRLLEDTDKSIDQAVDYVKYPQVSRSITVQDKSRVFSEDVVDHINRCESLILDTGRIVVRPSGTENCIRVMVEGENNSLVQEILDSICAKVKEVCK